MSNQARYLDAMGVRQWYSRYQLEAAAPSVIWSDVHCPDQSVIAQATTNQDDINASQSSSIDHNHRLSSVSEQAHPVNSVQVNNTDVQTAEKNVTSAIALTETSLQGQLEPTCAITNNKSEASLSAVQSIVAATTITAKASDVPRFRFFALQINDLLCFAAMPLVEQTQLTQTETAFLKNLAFALQAKLPQMGLAVEYKWPLFGNPAADEGVSKAQDFFMQRLQQHQQQGEIQSIFIFGDLLQQLQLEITQVQQQINANIVELPDLKQVLLNAENKRQLWQLVKHA